jgi:2-succinyl-5-enolpyruvyl-6-hydroxy-3-cyclohexene-1-carboxylate synthase
MIALSQPTTSLAASTALGDIPDSKAQRSLADVVLDPSRPIDLRRNSASQLARSIKHYGPLVSADQEVRLAAASRSAADPQFRSELENALTALRSWSHSNHKMAMGVHVPTAGPVVPGAGGSARNPR